jgi:hypothetical protein
MFCGPKTLVKELVKVACRTTSYLLGYTFSSSIQIELSSMGQGYHADILFFIEQPFLLTSLLIVRDM